MIRELRLKNFKGWKDTGNIRLAPLTVFFGTNSSGKTSLLQFLLLLKQTIQSPDRKLVLHFGDRDLPIDLGSYREAVHKHQEEESIEFSLSWELPNTMSVRDPRSNQSFAGKKICFESSLKQVGKEPRQRTAVDSMQYTLGDLDADGLSVGMNHNAQENKYDLTSQKYHFVRDQGQKCPLSEPVHFYGFPDEVRAYYQNADFVSQLTLGLEQQFNRIYYLGPLREYPGRSYRWTGEIPQDVGWRGEKAIAAILAAGERCISKGRKCEVTSFEHLIAEQLQVMGIIDSFRAVPVAKGSRDYEVLVKATSAACEVTLKDVGFGVSQVLPIIVQSFYAPENSTVIMEQPEIHLHPSVQADLANLFTNAIKAREYGRDRNIQLVVESHSEHFLRRIQTLIAEDNLKHDDVALYFCSMRSGVSSLEEVKVDELGNVLNWPDNFFGDQMGEIFHMQEAQLQRRKQRGE